MKVVRNKYRVPHYRVKLVRERIGRYVSDDLSCSDAAQQVLHDMLKDATREYVVVLYANAHNRLIGSEIVSMGGAHGAAITPRDVLIGVLLSGATSFLLGHNHPSGDPEPSRQDLELTREVARAAEVLGLRALDHLIVTRDGPWVSMASERRYRHVFDVGEP